MKCSEIYLKGYVATEYEDADRVDGVLNQNGKLYLYVFDGAAGRPCVLLV